VEFNGILIQFEETQEFNDYLFFKAVLAPKLWWLSLTHHNQVFLDLSIPEIMEDALKDGGLKPIYDFAFNLNPNNIYNKLEYICQYDESHFNFVSRWAEREGLYYFFEQTPNGEKVVFTDTKMEHKDLLLGKDLIYDPQSGLAALHTKEVIQSFICKHNLLPQRVYLKDYNYLKPSQAMEGIADVDENGRGENYIYGVNFDSVNEGNRLAKIRAEALLCRKSIFQGESSVPFMVPGYTFDLNEHYRDMYNRKYLVTDITHEGHQTGYLISGISDAIESRDEEMFYSNTFSAVYSDEQFRPEHLSKKPKISGTINAKVDASGSGEHAELDEHGRYKVILPFDRSGRFGGKASAFFRMMQPSAGQNQGMHFPLHKGTEVLLTFIDGNPDRPVIAGAVPNPETSSPVTDANQAVSAIVTGRNPDDNSAGAGDAKARGNSDTNNYIQFNDTNGKESITIHSPREIENYAGGKYKRRELGPSEETGHDKYEDKDDGDVPLGKKIDTNSANLKTENLLKIIQNFSPSNVYGYDEKATLPKYSKGAPNNLEEFVIAPVPNHPDTFTIFFNNTPKIWCFTDGTADDYDYYELPDLYKNVEEAWEDYWNYWVKKKHPTAKGYEKIVYINHTPSRPINHPWYVSQWDVVDDDTSKRLIDYLRQSDWDRHCEAKWEKWIKKTKKDWKKWMPHYIRGHVRGSHRDTFNMQEGNYYDFGGYWVYNLGNAYIENHVDQAAKLNSDDLPFDMLKKGGPAWNEGKTHGDNWKKVGDKRSNDRAKSKNELWETWKKKHESSGNNSQGWKNIWVEKKFGDSYDYRDGNAISITKGCVHDIKIGQRVIEEKWVKHSKDNAAHGIKKGDMNKTYYMRSGGGETWEKKWSSITGKQMLDSYSKSSPDKQSKLTKKTNWEEKTDHSINYAAKASASINFGATATTSLNFDAKTSLTMGFAASASLAISVGPKLDLSVSVAASLSVSYKRSYSASFSYTDSLDFTMKGGAGMGLELDYRIGGTFKLKHNGLKFDGIGITARTEAGVKAKKESAIAEAQEIRLASLMTRIDKNSASIRQCEVNLAMETIVRI